MTSEGPLKDEARRFRPGRSHTGRGGRGPSPECPRHTVSPIRPGGGKCLYNS